MTGWGLTDDKGPVTVPGTATTPTEATLAEVAALAQREQLKQLAAALRAHPDLAAQVFGMLRSSL